MKTLQKAVNQIDKYLYDLYANNELSKTEIINLLSDYVDYILLFNNLQPENYNINIHFIKEFDDCVTEFRYKDKKKKRKRSRNKENIKKLKHSEYAQTLAYVQIEKNLKDFKIYLNLKNSNISDIASVATTLSNLGHEVEHIIQQFKMRYENDKCINCFKEKVNTYKSLISKAANKAYIRKLTNKMHAHADNFALINSIETAADNNSVVYFSELFKLIKQNTNKENDYLYFLYDIYIFIELIQRSREKTYKQAIIRENKIKKSLIRDFKIDKNILEIP